MLGISESQQRVTAGRRRLEELGPAVLGIVAIDGPALVDQQVGGALHALPGQPETDSAGDLGDGQRLVEGRAQHLPPGWSQAGRFADVLGRGQELTVQLEDRQHQFGQGIAGRGPGRERPWPVRRSVCGRTRASTGRPTHALTKAS